MKALVLDGPGALSIRDIDIDEPLGAADARVALRTVGICGSDIQYFSHGRIGRFVVEKPLILGHEASGVVLEAGPEVRGVSPGDRVCMEPGVPDPHSRASRLGVYNLDPAVRFWATPPVHGVLRETVVHPAEFCYRLPDRVSFGEGAFVEPLAVAVHAVEKASLKPGGVAAVLGAGPIGASITLVALAAGAARVVVADVEEARLAIAARLGPVTTVNARERSAAEAVRELTGGFGADAVFEASGNPQSIASTVDVAAPGGVIVLVGEPQVKVEFDVVAMLAKEVRIATVFRYANDFERALRLIAEGRVDVRPLITKTFPFADAVAAFEFAAGSPAAALKVQIEMPER